jgi:soluble lytic murein transglycosylase
VTPLEALRAKGDALYRGGKYAEAARVLTQCAASGGPHVAEDAFRAARALARADRDDDAIAALKRVATTHARTTWGDQASFLIGKLELLHGRWADAAKTLDDYVAKYPGGQERHEATRDRGLAHLLSGDAHGARPILEQLAEDESDPLAAARARTMAALAALRDGDRTHAIARWTDVARSRPLSWPALVARARLAQIGAPIPPAVDPAPDAPAPAPLAITLPPPVDLLHRIGLDGDAESELRERETSLAALPPGRSVEGLCAAYGRFDRARRRYQVAQQIPAATLNVAPSPSTRWSWDCAFPAPYADEVAAVERAHALPPGLVHAVMRQESGFDPDAVSPAGAIGLLQLMPATALTLLGPHEKDEADAGEPAPIDDLLTIPRRNVALGARYLHDLLEHFHGKVPLAVAAYNGGPEAVDRWLKRPQGLDLDLFVERIPYAETRTYVARVLGNFARYGYLRAGEAGVPSIALETD